MEKATLLACALHRKELDLPRGLIDARCARGIHTHPQFAPRREAANTQLHHPRAKARERTAKGSRNGVQEAGTRAEEKEKVFQHLMSGQGRQDLSGPINGRLRRDSRGQQLLKRQQQQLH